MDEAILLTKDCHQTDVTYNCKCTDRCLRTNVIVLVTFRLCRRDIMVNVFIHVLFVCPGQCLQSLYKSLSTSTHLQKVARK